MTFRGGRSCFVGGLFFAIRVQLSYTVSFSYLFYNYIVIPSEVRGGIYSQYSGYEHCVSVSSPVQLIDISCRRYDVQGWGALVSLAGYSSLYAYNYRTQFLVHFSTTISSSRTRYEEGSIDNTSDTSIAYPLVHLYS
ncbi:hypothetical protein SAMN05660862_3850 [Sphingobacterium psychroaquaticum]|uniref:Uncharacterized protein n=1 Tax=Sphingobacterium psychroaquaticum TaxID=561061 RepID=A0A1X7LDN5_9SPHI|nr:hypothetical protein SAMN05660862_3850 [Sphingobacterium psychroaquaticum]